MLGAIIGDVVGSVYEYNNAKPSSFELFQHGCSITDDSVLTIAVAKAILECTSKNDFKNSKKYYLDHIRSYARKFPNAGYGQTFSIWLFSEDPKPYRSYGNGSGMRVSPVGYAFRDLAETLSEAKKSAEITHNHPDGIRGAQAIAGAVFLARNGSSKDDVRDFVENKIGYPLDFDLEDLHKNYKYEIQCAKSVPQAIFAFLVSSDFEDAIRKAVYIGGDCDTIACMTGAIAEAFYKIIPEEIRTRVLYYLDAEQKKVVKEFEERFGIRS